ncbi:MAG: protein kinase [Holophagaceae bacterium]|nr:protein kinase [Holophagaceae bacterium]
MGILRAGCVAAILFAAPLAAQNQTTFFQAYEEGQAAQRRGDHAVAVAAFRRALELRPQSSARLLTYSNVFISYYPQVYLAESLLALGKLDEAAQALDASARSKVEPLYLREKVEKRLKELRAAKKPEPVPKPPQTPPVATPAAPKDLPQKSTEPGPKPIEHPPVEKAQQPPKQPDSSQGKPLAPAPKPIVPTPQSVAASGPLTPGSVPVQAEKPSKPAASGTDQDPLTEASRQLSRLTFLLSAIALIAALGGVGYWGFRWWRKNHRRSVQMNQRTMAMSQPVSAELMAKLQNLPAELGPYMLDRVLGRGSFAITYAGHRRSDDVPVAVKVPHPHMIQDPDAMVRFRQEARLGALLDHPNIVCLVDPSPESGLPWMAMELVEGETLQEYLAREGRLEIPEVLRLGAEITRALAHAHGKGVVHRDLKPANVMVTEGHAKVMDFGIARVLDTVGLTATAFFLGTPAYAAPESLKGSRVGPPADRYALGIMIFEMLVGQAPFQAEHPLAVMDMHRSSELPDLGTLRPDAPRRLVRLVERLTTKNPEERPEDPEVLTILEDMIKHPGH